MKVTVVPAQVTTVEDRVAGNLGFIQLALFAIPVFGGSLLFAILPPGMGMAPYKIVLVALLAVVSGLLAIRIKGKLVLLWIAVLLRYHLRPRLYVFNKNSATYREDYPENHQPVSVTQTKQPQRDKLSLPRLSTQEAAYVYATFNDPANRLSFELTKKGGFNVHITEAQD